MNRVALRWSLALGTLAVSCAGPRDEPSAVRSAIVGGVPSDERDDAVVQITAKSEGIYCSATMVAPNLLITAIHCVSAYRGGSFRCDPDGSLYTTTPPDGEVGAVLDPSTVEVRVGVMPASAPDAYGKRIFGTGTNVICKGDIALVLLDRDLDVPIAPLRRYNPTIKGELLRAVGYGTTEVPGSGGRHRRDGLTILSVGPEGTEPGDSRTSPNTFKVNAGPCQGDSGGPAISEETGAVTGVYSLSVGMPCTSDVIVNVYTNVRPFYSSVIDQAFTAAGHERVPESGEGSAGDTGIGGGSAGEPGTSGSGGGTAFGGTSNSGGAATSGGATTSGGSSSGGKTSGEGSGSRRDSSCSLVGRGVRDANSAGMLAGAISLGAAAWRRRQRKP